MNPTIAMHRGAVAYDNGLLAHVLSEGRWAEDQIEGFGEFVTTEARDDHCGLGAAAAAGIAVMDVQVGDQFHQLVRGRHE